MSAVAADFLIRWRVLIRVFGAVGIPDFCRKHAFELVKEFLQAPETAACKINLILRSLKTAYDPFIYWLNRVKIVQMAFGSVNRLLQTSGSLLMNEQTSSLI